jgi:hypothetical protein
MMHRLKFRVGTAMAAMALATGTIVGAVALQGDPGVNAPAGPSTVNVPADEPIVYAGGYGLFPSR